MAIDKKLIHFKTWENFISSTGVNGNYTTPSSGTEASGDAIYGQVRGTSIVFIKDVEKIWTHGALYDCSNHEDMREIIEQVQASVEELQGLIGDLQTASATHTTKTYVDGLHSAISTAEINALFV